MTPSRLARALLDPQAVIGEEQQDDRRLKRSLLALGQQIEADAIEAAGARSALTVASEALAVVQAGADLGAALTSDGTLGAGDASPEGASTAPDHHEPSIDGELSVNGFKLFGDLIAPLPAQLGRAMDAERAEGNRQRQLAEDLAATARASAPKRA